MTEGYHALRHGAAWLDLDARGRIVREAVTRRLLHASPATKSKDGPGDSCYASCSTRRDAFRRPAPDLLATFPHRHDRLRERSSSISPLYHRDQVSWKMSARNRCIGVEGHRPRTSSSHRRLPSRHSPSRPARLPHLLPRRARALIAQLESLAPGRRGRRRVVASKTASAYGEDIRDTTCRRRPANAGNQLH